MSTRILGCIALLWAITALFSSCEEENAGLRFYEDSYEVAMGRVRYLGIESGNGDYTLEMENPLVAFAEVEHGWTGIPKGNAIYVKGLLTGSTRLTVTDTATGKEGAFALEELEMPKGILP